MKQATTANEREAGAGVQVLPYEAGAKRLWHVGSLTYTPATLTALFFWLLGGDFAWQLRDRAIAPSMPVLLRSFGASDFATGVLLGTLPAATGMVLAPIVSYLSDRHRSRLGRRIPFMLLATPIAMLAMMGLAASSWVGHAVHEYLGVGRVSLSACVIGVFAVFWTAFELAAVTCNALHGALINDVVPRPVLGRFFGMFRVISLGAGILFFSLVFKHVDQHYVAIFVAIGLLYGGVFSLMCLKVKEGEYPPPPVAPPVDHQEWWVLRLLRAVWSAVQIYLRDCFTRPVYLWYFFSFLLAFMSFAPINLYSVYYSQSVGMSKGTYGYFSSVQLGLSMVQAPILGWLCDKYHPLRMTLIALFMYAATTMLAFFFVRDWRTFAAAHVICGTCSGIWITTTSPLSQMLLPKMKFATFASALGIFQAVGQMITGPIVGKILDHINGGALPGNRDYHTIYLWASCFITLSLLATLVVFRYVKEHGGVEGYVAPE